MRSSLAAFLAVVLAGWQAGVSAERPSVAFAILRQDGVLVPFATFAGKWTNDWPAPVAHVEVPITTADVPKAWWPGRRPQIEWTLWRDGAPQRLTLTTPTWLPVFCTSSVGLRTDHRSSTPPPAPHTSPYPKEGLATSAGSDVVRVAPIRVLDPSSSEGKALLASLPPAFNKAEDLAASRSVLSIFLPDPARRAEGSIELESLYRAEDALPDRFVSYFEAVRRYPGRYPSTKPACALITFARGWLREGPDRYDLHIEALITECYRLDVSFMLPLGAVRVREGRPLWMVQWSNWTAEWYTVIDIREPADAKVLLTTIGGTC